MSTIEYRPDIDGLRALAVLSVVIYHVSPSTLPGGFLGVDVFFVISGYLISLIVFREASAGTFAFSAFYARRVQRLFPALASVFLTVVVFGGFALFADEYRLLAQHTSSAIVFLLNFRLMDEAGYFDIASETKPLLHLWSLAVEEQFYLAWPVLLVLLTRLGLHLGWVMVPAIAGSFLFAINLAEHNLDALYFHPLARGWELLMGGMLAYRHQRDGMPDWFASHPKMSDAISAAGLAAVVLSLFLWDKKLAHPGPFAAVPLLGVVALLAAGGRAIGNRLLALPPLVAIGLISYPLYLWHWPVLSYLRIVESGTPDVLLLWCGAGISIILAAITFRFIEQPLRHSARARAKLVALVGTMVALLVVSRVIVSTDGFPDRPAIRYVKTAEAQMKREPRQDEACLALFPRGSAPVYCRQEKPGRRMIALTGDSHAHVLFPGIAAEASEHGYGTLLLANSGCPPFEGAVTGRNATERARCATSIDNILDAIERDPRIEYIVIASRGPQYIDGTGFGPVEASYNYPPISSRLITDTAGLPPAEQVFRDSLERTVRRFHERGVRVAYVLQVPELGVPARSCLDRPLTLSARGHGCEVAYEIYRERMRNYRSLIASLSVARPYLTVIDLESAFCDRRSCSGYRDGVLLYADDNHLSTAGAGRVAPAIFQALGFDASVDVEAYRTGVRR